MWPIFTSLRRALSAKPMPKSAFRRRSVFHRPLLEALEDRTLLSIFMVTNTGDNNGVNPAPFAGTGTLRQAIVDADAANTATAANPDLITFAITSASDAAGGGTGFNAATGVATIQPLSALPTVTDTVVINGYTQSGASPNTLAVGDNAVLNIVLDGSQAGAVDGLVIASGNSTVRGLVIDNFASGSGIALNDSGNDLVEGNFIGTDVTGEIAAANNQGIWIKSGSDDTVGGASPGDRNIISGNNSTLPGTADGVGGPEDIGINAGNGDLIEGNYIGTDKSGAYAVGNGTGIAIGSNNTIGGLTATPGTGAGNVISGNFGDGIFDAAGNLNLVAGNLIGTTATGTRPLGNQFGVLISYIGGASNNTVGGTTTSARNVISGNAVCGVLLGYPNRVADATGNVVEGNFIGTDITGTMALGNGNAGIVVESEDTDTTIGGASYLSGGELAGAGNLISGQTAGAGVGIAILASGTQVYGNFIGTDITGTAALPNSLGVDVSGPNTTLGGLNGLGNLISGNTHGAMLFGSTATGAVIQGNLVGTDATGGADGRTLGDGSMEAGPNQMTIGGTAAGDGNVFAAGTVLIDGSPQNLVLEGNSVGTDRTGTIALGGDLVVDVDNSVTIGGSASGAGNVIAYSGGDGIVIGSGDNTGSVTITGNSIYGNLDSGVFVYSGTGNSILGNSIFANSLQGISLNNANNANDKQAAPVLTGVSGSAASPTITGSLTSVPNTTFRIEFFASPAPPAGNLSNTEGQTLLGFTYVTTDGSGYASFTASSLSPIPSGQNYLTATATVATPNGDGSYTYGDTSQFSAYLHVSYVFNGFLPPLDSKLTFGLNRVIPIKFQLTDLSGNSVTSLSAVTSLEVLNAQGTDVLAGAGNTGLRVAGNQFIYNWQTKGLSAGTYTITLVLADGTSYTKVVQLVAPGSAAAQVAAESGATDSGATAGGLLAGDIELYVSDPSGLLTADEQARIQDAINAVDQLVGPYGAGILETIDPTQADLVLDTGTSSAVGGYADGVLGCYSPTGEITLLQGWNWYAGADPTQVGAGQYDFETVVLHELGHALGLGEGSNSASAMYGTLASGTAVRTVTTADLNIPYDETGADGDHAAGASAVVDAQPAVASAATENVPAPAAVLGTSPKAAVPSRPADVLTPAVTGLAEAVVPDGSGKGGAGAPAVGIAPARLPATVVGTGERVRSPAAAIAARITQPAAGGGDGATPGAAPAPAKPGCPDTGEPTGRDRLPGRQPAAVAPDRLTAPAETGGERSKVTFDFFFASGPQGGDGVIGVGHGCDPADGGLALAAVLGAASGSRSPEPERRKQRLAGPR
jgi:hypothetical protein